MCDFITGFLPAGDGLATIEARLPQPLRRRLFLAFEPIDNPAILFDRPPGDRFVRFTERWRCDCGAALGNGIPRHDVDWWCSGRTKDESNPAKETERRSRQAFKEAGQWLSLFRYLAVEVGHFGLILHRGHDLEDFTTDRLERLDVMAATPATLLLLEFEVIHEVVC